MLFFVLCLNSGEANALQPGLTRTTLLSMLSPWNSVTSELKQRFPQHVHTDVETLYSNSFDGLKISFLPQAVIRPDEVGMIAPVLRLANQHRIPVTTRGVGSTLTGAATPVNGGWVLDLHQLSQIEIDPVHRIANVQCGAVVKDIQDSAAKVGLFYPPDPSSYKWCTIGGNIACNAGGLRCVKYGVTRDYVMGLKGFLADGSEVEWGKPVRKFATGYNLRDLWIGSEGTLGIITSATLKLIPLPTHRRTALLGFRSEKAALDATLDLMTSTLTPSILEFIDTLSVRGAQESIGYPLFEDDSDICVLLVEIDGTDAHLLDAELNSLRRWMDQHSSLQSIAASEAEAEALWTVRRQCSGAMFKLGNSKLNEDVVVPLSKMQDLIAHVSLLRETHHVPIAVFGHAGDGNLHVNIMYDREDKEMSLRAQNCLQSLMEKVVDLNGAISGEHGVGLAKSHFMELQFNEAQLRLMREIKAVFDPNGILNPGKWFEPFSPWNYQKESFRFPWDKH